MFAAHGIDVVIAAENHAALLGLGGSLLSLDIWVADEDSEEATALLHDLRERSGRDDADEEDDDSDVDEIHCDEGRAEREAASSANQRIDRRRRTGVALLLGCCITFGTAHIFAGAWMRGVALAALELVGIMWLSGGDAVGGLAIAIAIVSDMVGAVWRVRTTSRPALPVARLHGAS